MSYKNIYAIVSKIISLAKMSDAYPNSMLLKKSFEINYTYNGVG